MMKKDLFDYFYVPVFVSYNAVPYPEHTKAAFDLCGHYIPNALCGFAFPKEGDNIARLVNSDYELTHDCLEEFATVAWGILDLVQEIVSDVPGVTLINLRGNDARVREYLVVKCERDEDFDRDLTEYCSVIKHYSDNYQDYYGMQEGELTSYFGIVLTDKPFYDSVYVYTPEYFD